MFRCADLECEMGASRLTAEAASRFDHQCPFCGQKLVPLVTLDELEQRIVDEWPHPIALPFSRMLASENVHEKAERFQDVLTNTLKYLALVVASQYLRSDHNDDEVNVLLEVELQRSLVSSWHRFLEKSLSSMTRAGVELFTPELPSYYASVQTRVPAAQRFTPPEGYFDETGTRVEVGAAMGWIEALVNYRNRLAHRMTPSDDEARTLFESHYDVLRRILSRMEWCLRYPMFKWEDGRVTSLMGATPPPAPVDLNPSRDDGTLFLRANRDGSLLNLFPFFLVPTEIIAESRPDDSVLVYDRDLGRRILYLSPNGSTVPTVQTVSQWRELLERKKIVAPILDSDHLDVDEIARRSMAISHATESSLRRSQMVLEGAYCPRVTTEEQLEDWLDTGPQLALLCSIAGGGKTSTVDHLSSRWRKAGHTIIFVRSAFLEQDDIAEILRSALRLAPAISMRALVEAGANENRRFVVVLDGLNEHPRSKKVFDRTIALAQNLQGTGARVLITHRFESIENLEVSRTDRELFYDPKRRGYASEDEAEGTLALEASESDGPPLIDLGPLDYAEVEAMWEVMQTAAPSRMKPRFPLDDLVERNRRMLGVIQRPLLLRLFLEVFHGRDLALRINSRRLYQLKMRAVFQSTGDEGRFLLELCRVFLEHQSATLLLDVLYDDPRTRDVLRSRRIASPYRRLCADGVLLERRAAEGIQVSFVVESVFEHALGETLVRDGRADDPDSLAAVGAELEEFVNADGALRAALELRVARVGFGYLQSFIDAAKHHAGRLAGPALAAAVLDAETPEKLASALLETFTPNDLRAAVRASECLREQLQYESAFAFLEVLVGHDHENELEPGLAADFWGEVHLAATEVGRFHEAAEAAEREIEAVKLRDAEEEDADSLAAALIDVAVARGELGDFSAARARLGEALELVEDLGSSADDTRCVIRNRLGLLDMHQCRFKDALVHLEASHDLELRTQEAWGRDLSVSHNNLGLCHLRLGHLDEARAHFERSLEFIRTRSGERHPNYATFTNNVALVEMSQGKLDDAHLILSRCRKSLESIYGPQNPKLGPVLMNLGLVARERGRFEDARANLEMAANVQRQAAGDAHPDLCKTLLQLADLERTVGQLDAAVTRADESLRLLKGRGLDHSTDAAMARVTLGAAQLDLGLDEEARLNFERAKRDLIDEVGLRHTLVGVALQNLGVIALEQERFDEARAAFEENIAIQEELGSAETPEASMSIFNLGLIEHVLDNQEAAREYFEKALAIEDAIRDVNHPNAARTFCRYCDVLRNLGELDAVQENIEERLRRLEETVGDSREHEAQLREQLGRALYLKDDIDGSVEQFRACVSIEESIFGADHPNLGIVHRLIGWGHIDRGDVSSALTHFEKSVEILDRQEEYVDAELVDSLNALGKALIEADRFEDAHSAFERAESLVVPGGEVEDLQTIRLDRAWSLAFLGDGDNARELARDVLEKLEAAYGVEHPSVERCFTLIALVLEGQERYEEALETYDRHVQRDMRVHGDASPTLVELQKSRALVLEALERYDEAVEAARVSLGVLETSEDAPPLEVARGHTLVARMLEHEEDWASCVPHLETSLKIHLAELGCEHVDVGDTESDLGYVHLRQEDATAARAHLEKAVSCLEEIEDEYASRVLTVARFRLGLALLMDDAPSEAVESFSASADGYAALDGDLDDATCEARYWAAEATFESGDAVGAEKILESLRADLENAGKLDDESRATLEEALVRYRE